MLLNSNSDNSSFLLVWTFFWPFGQKELSLIWTSVHLTFLIFTLIVIKYLLHYYQILHLQKNEVCRKSAVFLHHLNLLFCLLIQFKFSLLACRKYETVLVKQADLPLERCPTTSPHLFNCDCVSVILVLWFWSSFENFSIFRIPLCHVSMITFDMSLQIILLDQKYW